MADRRSIPALLVVGSLLACSSSSLLAQGTEVPNFPALSEVERFALDGMDTGRAVINQNPQVALDEFGLPNQINIHRERAFWDIDTEETPAEWMYNGFSITVPFLRSADTSTGDWVPLNYRPGEFIDTMTVFDSAVPVRLGLNVGVHANVVLKALSLPSKAKSDGRIYTVVETEHLVGRNIDVEFHLDEEGYVTRISWSLAPWH